MKNPIDVGTKTLDAATVYCIRPVQPERTATLNTQKDFAYEIRTINRDGAFIEIPASRLPASPRLSPKSVRNLQSSAPRKRSARTGSPASRTSCRAPISRPSTIRSSNLPIPRPAAPPKSGSPRSGIKSSAPRRSSTSSPAAQRRAWMSKAHHSGAAKPILEMKSPDANGNTSRLAWNQRLCPSGVMRL